MRHRYSNLPVLGVFVLSAAFAQDAPPAQPPVAPAASTTPAPAATSAARSKEPDYPDPRTPVFGLFYWFVVPGNGPDIRSGKLSTSPETLLGIGGAHQTPGIEISAPITRTGVLHLEVFRTPGTGNQLAPQDTTLFSTGFSKGDKLATNYRTTEIKLYLEDLLWPHKFPVSRFRLKSLWELHYVFFKTSIDALNSNTALASGTRNVLLPTLGVAAEYALTRHILLRAAGSGFGLPHRSVLWDGEATISMRRRNLEFVGGAKAFHFKSSPAKDEYVTQGIYGGFVGLRYHFGS